MIRNMSMTEKNKLDEKISSMDKVNLNVEVPKDKNIINNVIALFVTFIMFNVKWIKYKNAEL